MFVLPPGLKKRKKKWRRGSKLEKSRDQQGKKENLKFKKP
ncbi:MAG: hypothetical protein Devi2KO_40130 [Devosia indica]